jgi:hypothetical protein
MAAARAGEPLAYGRDRLLEAHRILLDRNQADPGNPAIIGDLSDLDLALVTAAAAQAVRAGQTPRRMAPVVQQTTWPSLGQRVNRAVPARDGGISP